MIEHITPDQTTDLSTLVIASAISKKKKTSKNQSFYE